MKENGALKFFCLFSPSWDSESHLFFHHDGADSQRNFSGVLGCCCPSHSAQGGGSAQIIISTAPMLPSRKSLAIVEALFHGFSVLKSSSSESLADLPPTFWAC